MNAYELADRLHNIYKQDLKANCWDDAINDAATMLRQQADRIAELEAKLQLHDAMDKQCQSLMKQVKEIANGQ